MVASAETEPESKSDERFRQVAALVLEERVDQIVGLSRGLLDVTNSGSAERMWLATRRMRAGLELFKPCFKKSQYRGAFQEVKALSKTTGARRDIDAILSNIDGVGEEMSPAERKGIDLLEERLRRSQADANRALARVVHGRRMQAFRVRIEDLTDAVLHEAEGEMTESYKPLEEVPESAARLVEKRLVRLRRCVPGALESDGARDQHRMRVAAERLRYSLELTAEALGTRAHTARRAARGLQEVLGEIRDCDLALPEVREQLHLLEASDVETILERARGNRDLDPVLVQGAPNRAAYRGLDLLVVHLLARRQMLFERFRRLWLEQSRQGVWVALETAFR